MRQLTAATISDRRGSCGSQGSCGSRGSRGSQGNRGSYGNSGFTLIELVAALVIMGTLMAIGMPSLGHLAKRWQEAQCQENRARLLMVVLAEQDDAPLSSIDLAGYQEKYQLYCPGGGSWVLVETDGGMGIWCDLEGEMPRKEM